MEKTIEVSALNFADVVMVGHQDIEREPTPAEAADSARVTIRYWFAHMRGGASYIISEEQASLCRQYLNRQNIKGVS